MANIGNALANPEEYEFEVLKPGKYNAIVTGADREQDGNGNHFVKLEISIDGGGTLTERCYLTHQKEGAVRMGKRKLAQVCKAIGLDPEKVQDTDEMLNIPFVAETEQNEYNGNKYANLKNAHKRAAEAAKANDGKDDCPF